MKKIGQIITCLILGVILFVICFDYNKRTYPNEFYNVYLDGQLLGVIDSKENLEEYINARASHLINVEEVTTTYCADERTLDQIIIDENLQPIIDSSKDTKYYQNEAGAECLDITIEDGDVIEDIYTPKGLNIEKVLTFSGNLNTIEDIYNKIFSLKSFTIKGYQFTIKNGDGVENSDNLYIYVTDKSIFEQALNNLIYTYVGEQEYTKYLNETQDKIETVGSLLENVYIEDEITVKEVQIPINEVIYTDADSLTQFLLYGDNPITETYVVKENEMISDVAFNNHISNQEFLISNPKYRDENSLILPGTEVLIKETDPKLNVVSEILIVEDIENSFETIYRYDENEYVGYEEVIQEGEDGLERVTQKQKIVNGDIAFVEPVSKETLKTTVDRIVVIGDKQIPNVGDLNNWAWPSVSGWVITTDYAWRIQPITGEREFHQALDIAGMGYNSPIYSANNGTVIIKKYAYDFGNYIVVDHNNGYYTLYAHLNKFMEGIEVGSTVSRGQQIGYVGSTGYSTGPHIHFEVWKDCHFCRINPWSLYR